MVTPPTHPANPLRVGSWPGRAHPHFVGDFCDGLVRAGCDVVDVPDPCALRERLDVLHIHWPEEIYWGTGRRRKAGAMSTLAALARLKREGTRLVWMVHNLAPHHTWRRHLVPGWLLAAGVARLADGFMTLSPSTAAVVRRAIPALRHKPGASAYHPFYRRITPLASRDACRAALGMPAASRVFGLVGTVGRYKGVEELIDAFRASPDPDWRLIIAGRPDGRGYRGEIERRAGGDPRIVLEFAWLAEERMAMLTRASDVMVLPFRKYLHSGTLVYALSYDRPVVTVDAPFARDFAGLAGRDWVVTYDPPLTPAHLAAFREPASPPPALRGATAAELGSAAAAFYRSLR